MTASPRRCPASACIERSGCPADAGAATLPRDGVERILMLTLRFVAAAAETGDAACFDAAFEGAEAAFGPRDGALLVARAAALVRALKRDEVDLGFMPPPCRWLSRGEAHLLVALRLRLTDGRDACPVGLTGATRAALADLAVPVQAIASDLPMLPAAGLQPGSHSLV